MHYNVQLGFLAADAIREFSRAANNGETDRYTVFLQRSQEYCHAVRHKYVHLTEEQVLDNFPANLAAFMRAMIKNHQPSAEATAKLAIIKSLEETIEAVKREPRPSPQTYLDIAQTIYSTSAADPR